MTDLPHPTHCSICHQPITHKYHRYRDCDHQLCGVCAEGDHRADLCRWRYHCEHGERSGQCVVCSRTQD